MLIQNWGSIIQHISSLVPPVFYFLCMAVCLHIIDIIVLSVCFCSCDIYKLCTFKLTVLS
jgi:hypothetical protein